MLNKSYKDSEDTFIYKVDNWSRIRTLAKYGTLDPRNSQFDPEKALFRNIVTKTQTEKRAFVRDASIYVLQEGKK